MTHEGLDLTGWFVSSKGKDHATYFKPNKDGSSLSLTLLADGSALASVALHVSGGKDVLLRSLGYPAYYVAYQDNANNLFVVESYANADEAKRALVAVKEDKDYCVQEAVY